MNWAFKPSVHLSEIGHRKWITLIALYYRKKTEIKETPLPNRITVLMYFLNTCLVILKTVFFISQ